MLALGTYLALASPKSRQNRRPSSCDTRLSAKSGLPIRATENERLEKPRKAPSRQI
jgi:hypothetical protein